MSDTIEQLKTKLRDDDAEGVQDLLGRFPDLRALINQPVGPFDAPAIVCARSRFMVDVLLAAGADINAKSRWWAGGFGLLDSAETELAEYAIARGAIVDIHAAVRLGKTEKLKELLTSDPGLVHARGGDGQTPLHCAGTIDIARYLLEHGAAIDARDVDHESTPAQYMVRDRREIASYLVTQGCQTDLLMASALGDAGLVHRHLEGDPECIRMCVSDRWFPKVNPRSGGTIYIWTLGPAKTPHAVAREFGHEEVFEVLMQNSPDELKLAVAAELGDEAAVNKLQDRHPNLVRALTGDDRRKIADAARNNNTEAVRLMLAAGWPVDMRGQHGATPLHWAAFHGNARMVQILLRGNPPLEQTDEDYQSTPLGWAIYGSENGWHQETGDYAGTVKALLRAGARPPQTLGGSDKVRAALRRQSEVSGEGKMPDS
ncbi:MAG: ankyrin repeat domain-containing protein [Verrucomicrobiales bacterium]